MASNNSTSKGNMVRRISFRVSGGNVLPTGYNATISAEISFEGMTTDQLIDLTLSALKIDMQRWMRGKSKEFLENLVKNGYRCHATECGRSAVDDNELVGLLMDLGMDETAARATIADPTKRAKLIQRFTK